MTAEGLEKELPHEVTKLTLNLTYRALERLIGGNSELEVQLRRNAVERFFTHYIKSIVNSTEFKLFQDDLTRMMKMEFAHKIGTIQDAGWNKPTLTLNKEFQESLTKYIKDYVNDLINKALVNLNIEERLVQIVNDKLVKLMDRVQPMIDAATEKEVNQRVLERLQKAASL